MRGAVFVIFLAALLHGAVSSAAPRDEIPPEMQGRWPAYGTTSLAITGDITLTKSEIIFQTGQRLRLSFITTQVGVSGFFDQKLPARIFRIRKPADPMILNGNRLCGGTAAIDPVINPATYLTLVMIREKDLGDVKYGYMPPGDVLELSVFAGPGMLDPTTKTTRRFCGDYNYQKRSPPE